MVGDLGLVCALKSAAEIHFLVEIRVWVYCIIDYQHCSYFGSPSVAKSTTGAPAFIFGSFLSLTYLEHRSYRVRSFAPNPRPPLSLSRAWLEARTKLELVGLDTSIISKYLALRIGRGWVDGLEMMWGKREKGVWSGVWQCVKQMK